MKPKRCKACGVTKAVYCYHLTTFGTLQPRCKDCHRVTARESRRRLAVMTRPKDAARHWWRYRLDARHRVERLMYMAEYRRRTSGIEAHRV